MSNSSESDESVTSAMSNMGEDKVHGNARHTIFIPTAYDDRTVTTISTKIRRYLKEKCIPSRKCSVSCLTMLCPFLTWMRNYEWAWLPQDIVCGMTVSIMQIPQGMAYAFLAHVPAILGLYVSFFASLIYAFFGTSKHLAIGPVTVISLMTGYAVDRLSKSAIVFSAPANGSAENSTIEYEVFFDPVLIATTLAFAVGVIQLILSILHMGFISVFLSDAFISGYTTGTAVLAFTLQIPDLFGIKVNRWNGAFSIIYTFAQIRTGIASTNFVTLSISIISISALLICKELLDPFCKKKIEKFSIGRKLHIPIPIDLLILIFGTLFSYYFNFQEQHDVKIVKEIGVGFRSPTPPSTFLIRYLIKDALIIALVSFAITISISKTYAKKLRYKVEANQELAAQALCNLIGSFFSTYPCCGSLSRTSVFVHAGGQSQLANIFASAFMTIVILKMAALLEALPKACLASILVVALKSLLVQIKDIYHIGRLTKLEGMVWFVTCLATVLFDVDYGLIVGICFSFLVVIIRQCRPRVTVLGRYEADKVTNEIRLKKDVKEIPQMKIIRFESSILYFNAHYFRERILDSIDFQLTKSREYILNSKTTDELTSVNPNEISSLILDCSSVSELDFTGASIFLETIKELNDNDIKVYLCLMPYYNLELLKKMNMEKVCSVNVRNTIQEIIAELQSEREESSTTNL